MHEDVLRRPIEDRIHSVLSFDFRTAHAIGYRTYPDDLR